LSSFNSVDAATRVRMCCSASLGVTVATSTDCLRKRYASPAGCARFTLGRSGWFGSRQQRCPGWSPNRT
jgi:hypothetical protein